MTGKGRVFENLDDAGIPPGRPVVLTIGTFDGVHLAHRALLARAVQLAAKRGGIAVALTFRNHPRAIVSPENCPPLLTDWPLKQRLILDQAVDVVIGLEFNPEFSRIPAEDFVANIIAGRLRASAVLSGPGFHFGQGGKGHSDLLTAMQAAHGYTYECLEPVEWNGEKVSSTRIRRCLAEGDVATAGEMLARPHRNSGTVVVGDAIGRTIGFPTANLRLAKNILTPADGVYAVRVRFGGHEPWPGMMNIGWRPTVGGREHRAEVHLIGFDDDLVGLELSVDYIARLRGEQKFDGLGALKAQLAQDREAALEAVNAWRASSADDPAPGRT